jgi:adenosylhomocysteinase
VAASLVRDYNIPVFAIKGEDSDSYYSHIMAAVDHKPQFTMDDGAIISNSGHFNVEIDIPSLEKLSSSKRTTRTFVDEYTMKDGRRINLLGEGRLINLAAAEGHPASVMDMSFADQALSCEYMVKNHATLEKKVYTVPVELDKRVAKLKLESLGIKIDRLTPEQEEYLASWSEGT